METGIINIPRAALILRKDQKTVRKWLKEGLLPVVYDKGEPKVEAKVVYEVRNLIDEGKNLRKPHERMSLLESRVNRLERVVKALLNLNNSGVTMAISQLNDRELLKLYKEAKKEEGKKEWDEVSTRKWTAVFMQITEVDITRIELLKKEEAPWRTFLSLCNKMVDYWRGEYSEDPNYYELSYLLDQSRKNLRNSIMIYVKDRNRNIDAVFDDFFDLDPSDRLKKFVG